jgi:hypothetical protein
MARRQVGAAALVLGVVAAQGASAQSPSSTTIARWVEFAPGSSPAALAAGSWGDQPTSLTPTVLVRAVVTNAASCPAASLDHGTPLVLSQRFIGSQLTSTPGSAGATNGKAGYPQYFVSPTATSPANFANGTPMATTSWGECEAVVPPGHKVVTVDGVELKLPVANPKRILIMADTGCRINGNKSAAGANQQNCASPAAFPWSYLASYEATFKPDVILQVGDWFYRDTNCLTNGSETYPGCNTPSSPNYETWGDTFDSWNADVFFPAKTLLAAAPWIMARGNHESCGRGARGWYALLDPFPLANAGGTYATSIECPLTTAYPAPGATTATYTGDFEPSYVVPVGGVNILVHDSSFANDSAVDKNMAANYDIDLSALLNAVSAASAKPAIFATHKPTFGLSYGTAPTGCATGAGGTADASGDWTEQSVFNGGTGYTASAFKNGVPASIGLFVSGHVHQFQYFNFGTAGNINANFAPQLIVGTGGSLLDADCNTGIVPSGITDPAKFTQSNFPYVVEQSPSGTTTTTSNTFSHDEFGFAVLNAITDGMGNTTGFNADIYKISSARAGICRINLNPRSITCHL